jgi:hypothetical protein
LIAPLLTSPIDSMTDDKTSPAYAPANDALAELLTRRRNGKFVSPAKMDERLDRFLTRMRQANEIHD